MHLKNYSNSAFLYWQIFCCSKRKKASIRTNSYVHSYLFCKVQNSIILILKFGKLGWIKYVDKDVFIAVNCFGFHLEHNICIYKSSLLLLACCYTEQILKRYHRISLDFLQILFTTIKTFSFSYFFSFFCFLLVCVFSIMRAGKWFSPKIIWLISGNKTSSFWLRSSSIISPWSSSF